MASCPTLWIVTICYNNKNDMLIQNIKFCFAYSSKILTGNKDSIDLLKDGCYTISMVMRSIRHSVFDGL